MKTTSKKGIFPVPVLLKLVNLIDKLLKKKKLQFYGPFLWLGFNCQYFLHISFENRHW